MTGQDDERPLSTTRAVCAAVLSLGVPGLGQILGGAWGRGWAWYAAGGGLGLLLLAVAAVAAPTLLVAVAFIPALLATLLLFNVGASLDAYRVARGWRVRSRRWFRSTLVSAVLMVAIAGGVDFATTAVAPWRSFSIPSGSMLPTLQVGDYMLVDARMRGTLPNRGDVVVFTGPKDGRIDYVKRVVGLPGERVQMKGGRLWLNGAMVPRRDGGTYLASGEGPPVMLRRYVETLPGGRQHAILEASDNEMLDNTNEFVVPSGHFFVLGDNRDNSVDSRVMNAVGFVPVANVIGRAETLFWARDWGRVLDAVE